MKSCSQVDEARAVLRRLADPARATILQRFFKTGPGEYGEGDRFLGVGVPPVRKLAREYASMSRADVRSLLRSPIHEERLLALLIMVRQYQRGDAKQREGLFKLYRSHLKWINNWDLIDVTAEHIIGAHLYDGDRGLLYKLAQSSVLWRRRVAIMSTFHFIKRNDYEDTLRLAECLIADPHDLIHKAVGWMLREIGNRDRAIEESFLKQHYKCMPRTMLRYAIEKFPKAQRQAYLRGTVSWKSEVRSKSQGSENSSRLRRRLP